MQPHNRTVSFSLYISALAVSDTICVLVGKLFYLINVWKEILRNVDEI